MIFSVFRGVPVFGKFINVSIIEKSSSFNSGNISVLKGGISFLSSKFSFLIWGSSHIIRCSFFPVIIRVVPEGSFDDLVVTRTSTSSKNSAFLKSFHSIRASVTSPPQLLFLVKGYRQAEKRHNAQYLFSLALSVL